MIKKSLFLLLIIMCVGLLIPKKVFATNYNEANLFIDYRFSIDGDENSNYTFKLYNKTGSLYFESVYDSQSGQYLFSENHIGSILNDTFSVDYIKHSDEILNLSSKADFDSLINRYHLHGYYEYDDIFGWNNFNIFDYVPLILENTNTGLKKIVIASLVINSGLMGTPENFVILENHLYYQPNLFLINNTIYNDNCMYYDYNCKLFNYYYSESLFDNINLMRNAVYDYSDELWEQLNNGHIASSEMNYDDSSVVLDGQNLDLTKASILRFNKKDNVVKDDDSKSNDIDSNKSDNIINKITNPKTWNNGVVILVISMIIIIGSSFILIKRKNN